MSAFKDEPTADIETPAPEVDAAAQDLSDREDRDDEHDFDEEALAGDTVEPWMQEVDLAALSRQDLGPSNIKREVMALEAAVQRIPQELREALESELRVTFREVRPYQKP